MASDVSRQLAAKRVGRAVTDTAAQQAGLFSSDDKRAH